MLYVNLIGFMGPLEIEMMKERFSKLLLGEDMSGCGNGVCTALAISNAITNLCGMCDIIYMCFSSSALIWFFAFLNMT